MIKTLGSKATDGSRRDMYPAEIKRRARFKNPGIRMSANNVRDVIQVLLKEGIVEKVEIRKKAHLRYRLTGLGEKIWELLDEVERVEWNLRKVEISRNAVESTLRRAT